MGPVRAGNTGFKSSADCIRLDAMSSQLFSITFDWTPREEKIIGARGYPMQLTWCL